MLRQRLNDLWYRVRRRVAPSQYEKLSAGVVYPELSLDELRQVGSCSQYGQDWWVHNTLLNGQMDGVFVDIGAHDGVTFSNTCYFERKLGWHGLCVEPNPEVFVKLDANRLCHKINGAVGRSRGVGSFQILTGYTEMLSGLTETYDERLLSRIEHEQSLYGGERRVIDVQVYPLNELLEKFGIKKVDYLTIDTEGAELSILQSLDLKSLDIRVIGLENNHQDWRLPHLLKENGFQFHSLLGDEFYVRN